jgi:hypothetical protein
LKTKFITTGLLTATILISSVLPVAAQKPEEMDPQMAAMMAKWAEIKTPGAPHKKFEEMTGKWSATAKFWMDPSAPPSESKGTAEFKTILGGRYLVQEFTGDWMGQTFHGMGITAFDNFRQEYIDLWFDDMGTGIFISRGADDPAGKVITCKGMTDDPMTGQKDIPTRSVSTTVDKDTHTMEMYATGPDGKEFKSMEMTYKRLK